MTGATRSLSNFFDAKTCLITLMKPALFPKILLASSLLLFSFGTAHAQAGSKTSKTVDTKMSIAPAAVKAGKSIVATMTVSSKIKVPDAIVVMYVLVEKGGQWIQLIQLMKDKQLLMPGKTATYKWMWTPKTKGDYLIKTGIFTNQWKVLDWNDKARPFTAK